MADTLYDSNFTSETDVTAYFQTNISLAAFQPLDGRTVHALVNIYEEVNSTDKFGYELKSYICLSRTKIDLSAPIEPIGPTRFACSDSHCNKDRGLVTSHGYMQFSPSPTSLKLELGSVDDGNTLIEFTGVQLLRVRPTPAHQDAACSAIPIGHVIGAGGNGTGDKTLDAEPSEPYALADTDFNTFVDVGSGRAEWKETVPTPGRPEDLPTWPG